jgi:DNA polymerase I-like protein with 3'-5' exonuclease and polymerase domains
MIVAPPGYWLLAIDYSVLELRTLAQICLRRYGRSVLADLFRQGIDPHRYTAALLLGKTLPQFEQLPADEQKQHRQRAKAINFGVPGGLGAASLVSVAKYSYGVQLTIEQAKEFRTQLVKQVYPELSAYLRNDQHRTIAENLHASVALVRQTFGRRDQIATAIRIVSGCNSTPDGDTYQLELVDYVWQCLQQLNQNPELTLDLVAQRPGSTLMRRIFCGNTCTISGRLRGHVNFTQRANSPFQGLAADGNKLALFRLLRAGYQVCGFVHDEALVLIPDGADYTETVEQVQQILVAAMCELTPDVPICTEFLLADRWYKDVDEQPIGVLGNIVPFSKYREVADPLLPSAVKRRKLSRSAYDPDSLWSFCLPENARV